jgi:hypothetical protein
MSWVMTSKRVPGGIEICVGSIRIASITFDRDKKASLWRLQPELGYERQQCNSVKDALHLLHTELHSAPPEGFEVPKFKKGTPE